MTHNIKPVFLIVTSFVEKAVTFLPGSHKKSRANAWLVEERLFFNERKIFQDTVRDLP